MRIKLFLSLLDCIAATTIVGVSLYMGVVFGRWYFFPPPLVIEGLGEVPYRSDFGNWPFKFLMLGSVGVILGTPWAIYAWRQFVITLKLAKTQEPESPPARPAD